MIYIEQAENTNLYNAQSTRVFFYVIAIHCIALDTHSTDSKWHSDVSVK